MSKKEPSFGKGIKRLDLNRLIEKFEIPVKGYSQVEVNGKTMNVQIKEGKSLLRGYAWGKWWYTQVKNGHTTEKKLKIAVNNIRRQFMHKLGFQEITEMEEFINEKWVKRIL